MEDVVFTWCPVCGKVTAHRHIDQPTLLLIYSGELIDGKPITPLKSADTGCPYWKQKHCVIHGSDHHFEVSPDFDNAKPTKRIPENVKHQSCRPPRPGELVCMECLEAAENGFSVREIQEELGGCDRRVVYTRAANHNIARRYIIQPNKGRPERRFTQYEFEILTGKKVKMDPPDTEHKEPVYCPECGTRLE